MNIRNMIGEDRIAKGLWWGEGKFLVTGCTKVSESCKNCWAETYHKRREKGPYSQVMFHPNRLKAFRRKKPTAFSIWTDLFHEHVDCHSIGETFNKIYENPRHVFMVLTKRPENIIPKLEAIDVMVKGRMQNIPNLWLGTTVESPEYLHRIDDLLKLRPYASKLFVSIEPMLGEVDFRCLFTDAEITTMGTGFNIKSKIANMHSLNFVDWVICGAESGVNRRPTDIEWIRSLRDQCTSAGVRFFLKQMEVDGKLVKAPKLDGRQWLELPEIGG